MNRDTLAAIGVVVAAVALGFVFGVEVTGRLATTPVRDSALAVAQLPQPEDWVPTAKAYRNAALGLFTVAVVGATAVWVRGEDE